MNNNELPQLPGWPEQYTVGGNLKSRKTIQAQKLEIDELKRRVDALLKVTVDQGERIGELNNNLEFKSILLSAALADLDRMDDKLFDAVNRVLNAQDEFFNLGDACMNRLAGVTSPFQYE